MKTNFKATKNNHFFKVITKIITFQRDRGVLFYCRMQIFLPNSQKQNKTQETKTSQIPSNKNSKKNLPSNRNSTKQKKKCLLNKQMSK